MKGSDVQEIVVRYKQGELEAINELPEAIDGMVYSLIKKYRKKCSFEDMYQQAWLIIMRCIEKYDTSSSASFVTYSYKALSNDLINYENRERKNLNKYDKDGNCLRGLISKDADFKGEYGDLTIEATLADNTEWSTEKRVVFEDSIPIVYAVANKIKNSIRRKIITDYLLGKRQCDTANELNITYAYVSKAISDFVAECQKILGDD